MGALLLVLVILNAFATGWLLSQVKHIKRTVAGVAKVQTDIARQDFSRSRDSLYDFEED